LAAGPQGDYRCITTQAQLADVVAQLRTAPLIALDTETTGTRPMLDRLCGISLSIKPSQGWYIPVRSPTPEHHLDESTALATLKPVLEDPEHQEVRTQSQVRHADPAQRGGFGLRASVSTAWWRVTSSMRRDRRMGLRPYRSRC
jgi:DNA polymerase I-like protein with 3'-5' exonuclease and polymerase domains